MPELTPEAAMLIYGPLGVMCLLLWKAFLGLVKELKDIVINNTAAKTEMTAALRELKETIRDRLG